MQIILIYPHKDKIISLMYNILKSGILILEDGQKDKDKIVHILKLIRDIINSIKPDIRRYLKTFLYQNNMTFLYNLTSELFSDNSTFINDLFDVLENHTEIFNYTLIFINKITDGKNITQDDFFNYMYNILNIDGMDKVFGHIVNSTHNGALLMLVEEFVNRTEYAEIYASLKEKIIYPHKDKVIRLVYNVLKSGILILEDGPKDKKRIVDILKLIRDIINSIKPDIREYLKTLLNQNNMTFLYNLTSELFSDNSTFINDLFDVLENHTEIFNYTLIFINEIIYKNVTEVDEIFKHLQKILNIDGMDKVFGHLVNSTHNSALLILFEKKFLIKKSYNDLYHSIKEDIIYPYKDLLIRLIYKVIKAFSNKNKLIEVLKNFFQENVNSNLTKILREKLKEEKVKQAFKKFSINGKNGNIIKEEFKIKFLYFLFICNFFILLNSKT